jgi:hypothetical protein
MGKKKKQKIRVPKVGDIQRDFNGSEWIVITVTGRGITSRVRRNSLAHQIHAENSPVIARSLMTSEVSNADS